jgi:UDP-N-acetylmuramyl pentapeptide synthase
MKVYEAINKVQAVLAATGISKDRRNQQQGYSFRGIDDVYNALSPVLAECGLCVLPRMLSRTCEERTNSKGTALFYVTVEAEFDLVSSEDGSKHTVRTFGEAMDSGDKATNKAMSAAYKYAAMQTFAIPTEGDNDADSTTHDGVQPKAKQGGALPDKVLADHMAAINDAADMPALVKAFGDAYKAAQLVNDQAAVGTFTTLKDKRKAALAQPEAA